jgi:hypothetical protein
VIHPDDGREGGSRGGSNLSEEGNENDSPNGIGIIRKDGTERTIEDVTLIVKKKGKITHYEGIIWDVTESERSHKERERE